MRFDIIGIILFILAVILFTYSGALSQANNALYRRGKRTKALITDMSGEKQDDGSGLYKATIKYQVDGKDYIKELPESPERIGEINDLTEIIYLPSDPNRFELYKNAENEKRANVVAIIAAIFAVVGIFCIIMYFVK